MEMQQNRQEYHEPQLTEHGSLIEIVQAGGLGPADLGGSFSQA